MSLAGVTSHIAEPIKGVEAVYDRHGYDTEKGHALEALASLVERIVNPLEGGNVVPLARGVISTS